MSKLFAIWIENLNARSRASRDLRGVALPRFVHGVVEKICMLDRGQGF
jgi:hypothetical protein